MLRQYPFHGSRERLAVFGMHDREVFRQRGRSLMESKPWIRNISGDQ